MSYVSIHEMVDANLQVKADSLKFWKTVVAIFMTGTWSFERGGMKA